MELAARRGCRDEKDGLLLFVLLTCCFHLLLHLRNAKTKTKLQKVQLQGCYEWEYEAKIC